MTSHLLVLGLLRITALQEDVKHQEWRDRSPRDIEYVRMELNEDGRIFRDDVLQINR